MGGSCCKSGGGSEAKFCIKMILALFVFCFCGIVSCSPVTEVEDRGLVGDIAMGILVGKIQEMLGITTTPKPRPVLDGIAGLFGATTTTAAHQPRKRNLAFSKPCSPCSSLLPPQPPPQHLPPPNVAAFWEVGSLVVPAMTRPPPPQLLQPPPPQSVEAFLEEAFSVAQAMTRLQPPPPQPRQPQPQPPPNVEVLLEGDFFAKDAPFFCRTTYLLDAKLNTICKVEEPFSEENM